MGTKFNLHTLFDLDLNKLTIKIMKQLGKFEYWQVFNDNNELLFILVMIMLF